MSKSYTLRLTQSAEGDLAEIWAYIAAETSEVVATRQLERIEVTMTGLLTFPQANRARNQLGEGLRVAFNGNYAIYYMVQEMAQEAEVLIVRVLHGARDVAAIADRGGFLVD